MSYGIRNGVLVCAALGVASLCSATGLAGDPADTVDPGSSQRQTYLNGEKASAGSTENDSTLAAIRKLRARIDDLDKQIKAVSSACQQQSTVTSKAAATEPQVRLVRRVVTVLPGSAASGLSMIPGQREFRPLVTNALVTNATVVPVNASGSPLFYQSRTNGFPAAFNTPQQGVFTTQNSVVHSPFTVLYYQLENATQQSKAATNCIKH